MGAPRSEQLPLLRVKPDRDLGYRPLSGDQHYGYDQFITLNHLGLRGQDVGRKDQDEYRILVFGGTQVYGLGIEDRDLVSSVLEAQLRQFVSDRSYRVINFGVRAYTLTQQARFLEQVGVGLNPDHVVVVVDQYTLAPTDIQTYYHRISGRDWYMLDLDAKPDGEALGKWYIIQMARKSALVSWFYNVYKMWKQRNSVITQLLQGNPERFIQEQRVHVEAQIDALLALAQQHHFQLSIALLPVSSQVSDPAPDLLYQSTIRDLATTRGIMFFDLLEPLRHLYQQTQTLPVAPFDEHYDADAHKAIGMFLAERLARYIRSHATIS